MKLNSILSAALFAAIAALSMSAQAVSDTDKTVEAKAPVAGVQADKKMKPHSHVEVKTGVPQSAPEAKTDKTDPAKDKTKHFHPRDGKT
jgi:Ni/Co efflux regulator RcnB